VAATELTPEQILVENVMAPAFFAKVAQETNLNPSSPETAHDLRRMGDFVNHTVDLYLQKVASSRRNDNDALIKGAVEAVVPTPTVKVDTTSKSAVDLFFATPAVADAARKLAEAKKAADAAKATT